MFKFACIALVCAVSVASISGCTPPDDTPDLSTVSGRVTLSGAPVANVTVTFQSANGQVAYGNTDADGKYELMFRNGAKGAEQGANTVRIETVLDAPPAPGYKDPIPPKYNTASDLSVTVAPGGNTFDFELTP